MLSLRAAVLCLAVLAWLAMIVRLGDHGGDRATVPMLDSRVQPSAPAAGATISTLGIFQGGARVGRTWFSLEAVQDGYRLEQETLLALTILGEARFVETRLSAQLASDFSLRSLSAALESAGSRYVATAETRGNELVYEADLGASRTRGAIPLTEPVYLPIGARLFVAMDLRAGREQVFTVLDPLALREESLHIRVVSGDSRSGPDAREAWLLEETLRGMTTSVWVDPRGHVLAEKGPLGLESRWEVEEAAGGGLQPIEPFDVEAATAIAVGPIDQPRTRAELRLRLAGIDAASIPESEAQSVQGDTIVLRRVRTEEVGTFSLPYRDGEFARFVLPTESLQSEHPRILAVAREVLGSETDALAAAQLLATWVYEYLEKVPTLSVPNALTVLDAGRGDCNEHAVLFSALARAVGLPSRVAVGLVFVDGRFVYHAWSEVRGAEGWLPVDAALGQFPADATHLALAFGEVVQQAEVVAAVGRLRLTPLD